MNDKFSQIQKEEIALIYEKYPKYFKLLKEYQRRLKSSDYHIFDAHIVQTMVSPLKKIDTLFLTRGSDGYGCKDSKENFIHCLSNIYISCYDGFPEITTGNPTVFKEDEYLEISRFSRRILTQPETSAIKYKGWVEEGFKNKERITFFNAQDFCEVNLNDLVKEVMIEKCMPYKGEEFFKAMNEEFNLK